MTITRRAISCAACLALLAPLASQERQGEPREATGEKRLQRRGEGNGERRQERGTRGAELQSLFDRMFDDLETWFDVEVPREAFFDDEFFKDLERQLQGDGDPLAGFGTAGQALSLRIDESGVRVTLREKDPSGKIEERVYEAPDLESFRRQYPDVARRLNLEGTPAAPLQRAWPPSFEVLPRWSAPEDQDVPAGERLGVLVRPGLSEDLRRHLDLEEGVGLYVSEVVDGSLARALGIEADDIVLSIGGQPIGSPADVRSALRGIAAGETVEVVVLRRGERTTSSAEKPRRAPEGGGENDDGGRR